MFMSPSDKRKLRQHAIFLDDAKLSKAIGVNPQTQIENILDYEVPHFIEQQRADGWDSGTPVPVMFWAHGGNVMRHTARDEALRHIDTWLDNGIYPIYVLWDTGPIATVGDALEETGAADDADRKTRPEIIDIYHQSTLDNIFDAALNAAEARDIWREMKEAAKTSNLPGGGGHTFVNLLAKKNGLKDDIELHAVGHSAGAIFHAYFTPLLLEHGFNVKSLQLLAPAIRIETYEDFLTKVPTNRPTIERMVMFTMDEAHELADKLLHIYRAGSLLYFIRDDLDPVDPSALLGLQVSYRAAEVAVRDSFAQVTFTPTKDGAQRGRQSDAESHTAFSSDAATLNSIAYNILGTAPKYPFLNRRRWFAG